MHQIVITATPHQNSRHHPLAHLENVILKTEPEESLIKPCYRPDGKIRVGRIHEAVFTYVRSCNAYGYFRCYIGTQGSLVLVDAIAVTYRPVTGSWVGWNKCILRWFDRFRWRVREGIEMVLRGVALERSGVFFILGLGLRRDFMLVHGRFTCRHCSVI